VLSVQCKRSLPVGILVPSHRLPAEWVPRSFPGGKVNGPWGCPLNSIYCLGTSAPICAFRTCEVPMWIFGTVAAGCGVDWSGLMADACKQNTVASGTTKCGACTGIAEPPLASLWYLARCAYQCDYENSALKGNFAMLQDYPSVYNITYLPTYLPAYLLTRSMEQSPSWEAYRFSASQEIPRILWNQPAGSLPHSQMLLSL
jgi:hypothetical protein